MPKMLAALDQVERHARAPRRDEGNRAIAWRNRRCCSFRSATSRFQARASAGAGSGGQLLPARGKANATSRVSRRRTMYFQYAVCSTISQMLCRPRRGRHNIWEIVLHTAYWKYIVRRRLTRDVALAFPRAGSNWPPLPAPADARAWKRDVALLKEQHRLLRQAIARLPSSRLGARAWRSTWSNAANIFGIASHDLYHAG